ncbi:MAG: endonuclease/exonuclease/phosphatase family protein [Gammaproteobacteria bacterium]|nr:MAG: endonuclease/exonuclease/phosphatase family protein [Gammaproteobacteria bacterium]
MERRQVTELFNNISIQQLLFSSMNFSSRMFTFIDRRVQFIAIALLVTSLFSLLDRWLWLADLTTHFVPHYAFTSVVLLIWFAISHNRRWLLILVALLAFYLIQLWPLWSPEPAMTQGDELRIFHYNVSLENQTPGKVIDYLLSVQPSPDIIILMETTPAWRPALKRLNNTYPVYTTALRDDPFGMAVFTRLAQASIHSALLGDVDIPAVILNASTPDKSAAFTLYAIHPPPPINQAMFKRRNVMYKATAEAIRLASKNKGQRAALVIGDLNSTPWSSAFAGLLKSASLRDSAQGFGLHNTWSPAWLPKLLGIPIDHALISSGISVTDRRLGPDLGSDHLPLNLVLQIRA